MAKRVGVIEFLQESNTFTSGRTGLNDFLASWYFTGQEVLENLRETNTPIAGCIDAASRFGWMLTPTVAAHAEPGGPVTEEARQKITGDILMRLQENGPFDALFISLHGAMVTETSQDGESQFLKAVRGVVGDIPIAITLDLHANIFDEMVDLVDIVISYRTYPHIDMREVGDEACRLLERVLNGEISPRVTIARPPMILGCDDGRTTNDGPMCRILEQAEQEMQAPEILNVAVNAGFTDADVFACGPSVLVTYDRLKDHGVRALEVANKLCDTIWSYRDDWDKPMDLSDCIDRLSTSTLGSGPCVVADFSDNPGSGAYSDCTAILSALINAGLTEATLGILYDPKAAAELAEAGIGAEVTLTVGGKTDPNVGGGPVELKGTVQAVSDGKFVFEGPMNAGVPSSMGTSVCFRASGVDVLISSKRIQMHDKNMFRAVGIEPAERAIVVVKSMQHFRQAFEPIASEVLVTDAGGLCTPNVTLRNYKNLRRPVFPLDEIDAGHL
ncbi:M81 family metallopeptidase [Ruegeria atlantica]|uniref:M81 family metallopeptidase n=1 Tax=Ruegeria atlantica TaxID=81569 RepID=UPI001480DECB|nr:M81 family metallopeptidase [Ruegeria atlantica]